jgi:dihydroneopterin aldolase/2-amino-4-hydroxy-6-hydroxymethyldihydropteridine diphosphokinase/dihydropteroate synthase
MGRNFGEIKNGPRVVDLDILFYGNREVNLPSLIIPHPRIQERLFVLAPLSEYAELLLISSIAGDFYHPTLFRTVKQLKRLLIYGHQVPDIIHKVMPIRGTVWNFSKRTYVMGILNVTPDSFSDGGNSSSLDTALGNALKMISNGADVIDIGGQSTAPNRPEITAEEEISRVVPIIQAIRAINATIPISVDTFRSKVAQAAIEAGADLINDVSGGNRDPEMLTVMATSRVPVCLMHMRGNSATMQQLVNYKGNLLTSIRDELSTSISNAIARGIFRWNISVDPGIGFAKDVMQNFEILRNLSSLTISGSLLEGMPILVGVSRKSFIGKVTNQEIASERTFGSAAATTASILGGAAIVRVHDVKEMKEVCLVSDSLIKVK